MFRQSTLTPSYLKASHANNPTEITPILRSDLLEIEGRIDRQIAKSTASRLEEDFGKYLHIIRQLENAKKENQESFNGGKLKNTQLIFDKIQTKLEETRQPEYIALITQIFEYEQTEGHNKDLVTSAVKLANTFKYDTSATSKKTLTDATNVLADNSAENRNKFLENIDNNRKTKCKKAGFRFGIAATFLGAAMIAAGIACAVTGVGFLPAYFLITFGTLFVLVPGVLALVVTARKSYGLEENALVGFGDGMLDAAKSKDADQCTAKIGFFSTTKDETKVTPLNEEVDRTHSLN